MSEPTWWRDAVVYQIYPRSFADANGDGMGDLRGITSRVDYLSALGVDAVWLSPFYPSALADGGYDVDDYRDVDPRLGTLADFDEMVAAGHAAGIKVIVDIVPNHTSNRHEWFTAALASPPGSRERHRYIFRDGLGPNGEQPPSDWQSGFGGPAWEPVGDGQWYFHHFAREQPDLNWDDEHVREDFVRTLRFWSDRGVDGFRVDVAHGLAKDMSEPLAPWEEVGFEGTRDDGSHPLWDRDDVHEIYAQWRRVFNEYDPPRFAVAEASVHPSRRPRYASPDGLGQVFNFEMQEADWSPESYRAVIDSGLADTAAGGSSTTWLLGCHDATRVATRYGLTLAPDQTRIEAGHAWLRSDGTLPLDRELGQRRARAAALVLLALPGAMYVYQGDELGLHEVGDLPQDVLQDPIAARSQGAQKGRDGCRVPLPWVAGQPAFGFGGPAGAEPDLPQPAWFADAAVDVQTGDETSTLELWRRGIALRHELAGGDDFTWHTAGEEVLHFERPGGWHCVTNFGAEPVELPDGELLVASAPLVDGRLGADATAWIRVTD